MIGGTLALDGQLHKPLILTPSPPVAASHLVSPSRL